MGASVASPFCVKARMVALAAAGWPRQWVAAPGFMAQIVVHVSAANSQRARPAVVWSRRGVHSPAIKPDVASPRFGCQLAGRRRLSALPLAGLTAQRGFQSRDQPRLVRVWSWLVAQQQISTARSALFLLRGNAKGPCFTLARPSVCDRVRCNVQRSPKAPFAVVHPQREGWDCYDCLRACSKTHMVAAA